MTASVIVALATMPSLDKGVFMCFCGDSACPNCGFLQGTFGNDVPKKPNPSKAIYEVLVRHPNGLGLGEVVALVSQQIPGIALSTVGRLLCLMAIERWVTSVGTTYFASGPNGMPLSEVG